MSTQAYCLYPRGSNSVRGIYHGSKPEEVVITVQNDGVICYNSIRRELVSSWVLGSQHLKFLTKAIFAPISNSFHAVVQQSDDSSTQSLLSWLSSSPNGSLELLAQRHTLAGNVHSIHPTPACHNRPLGSAHSQADDSSSAVVIVYTDGRVGFGVQDCTQSRDRPAGTRPLHSHADKGILAVINKLKGSNKHQLDLYDLQGQRHVSTSDIPAPSRTARLMSSSFQEHYITVMWSNGLLQTFNTAIHQSPAGARLSIHTSRHLLAFDLGSEHMLVDDAQKDVQQQQQQQQEQKQQQLALKKKRKAAAAAVTAEPDDNAASNSLVPMLSPLGGHSVVAIREPEHLPTNGHASVDVEATVADAQYGCVQSVTGIKLPGDAASVGRSSDLGRSEQDVLQLRSGMGNLVLLMHNAVWYISIPAQRAGLASLVGALNLHTPTHPAVQASIQAFGEEQCTNISTPPQVEYARPAWSQSLIHSTEASSSGYDDQAPVAAPATVRWQLDVSTQQAQLVEEQLTQQLTHGWTDKESCRMFLDGILKSCRDTKLHLSSQLVASTAAYLAQHKLWGSLDDLLRAQALPSLTMCPGLVLAIVEGGHFSLLSSILPKSQDLPEQELRSILKLLLSPATPFMQTKFKHHRTRLRALAMTAVTSAEEACIAHITTEGELSPTDDALQDKVTRAAYAAAAVDGLLAQEVCLHAVASMTYDPALLLAVLRQLSGSQAVALAQYLLKLMTKYADSLNDITPVWLEGSKTPLRIPTLHQVLEWLSLLFDSHITSFHRQTGALEVLQRLQRLVARHIGMLQQMSQLRGITEHLTSKSPVPFADHQADSLYSVELLDFRIL